MSGSSFSETMLLHGWGGTGSWCPCPCYLANSLLRECITLCLKVPALLVHTTAMSHILSSLSFSWTVLYLLGLVQGFPSWLNSHSVPLMFALMEAIKPLSGLCFVRWENQAEVGDKEFFFDLPLDHFKSSKWNQKLFGGHSMIFFSHNLITENLETVLHSGWNTSKF